VSDSPSTNAVLHGSKPLFRALIEHSWDAISLVTADAIILYFSPSATRILGYAVDELIGQNAFTLIHPEDQQVSMSLFAALLQQSGGSMTAQFRFRHQDGSWRWLEAVGTNLLAEPAVQAVVVNFRDITDRKEAEEALRESSQLNKQIIASVHEGVIVYDRDLRYVLWNPYMEEMSGLSNEQVAGKHPWDLFPYLREIGIEGLLRKALAGETVIGPDIPYSMPRSGKSGWGSGHFGPLRNASGEIVGVIGTVRDITERKRDEEERRKLEIQMQHTQKLESLGVLAGGLAHDFNNLLTGVLGNACLALQELPPGTALHDTIKAIEIASLRAADLTKQMLAYAGKGRFVIQPVHLSGMVEEMATLLKTVVSKKAVLRFDFAAGLPPVEADATQLRQVVMNLITNASDALGGDGGVITLRTRLVAVGSPSPSATFFPASLPTGRYVSLEVSDTGSGMDEATKAKIFEPFFTTKFAGRGLGLSAVLGIVRGHKGAIQVSSEPGQGTTVQVLLPALDRAESRVSNESIASADWRGGGSILVVDDDPITCQVAQKILEKAGFRVLLAHDGQEGVEVLLQHRQEVVAVLLDLVMPKKSGDEVFRQLRSLNPGLPIVLISGFHERAVSELFQGGIPALFVEKPFQPATILKALRQAMTRCAAVDGTGLRASAEA